MATLSSPSTTSKAYTGRVFEEKQMLTHSRIASHTLQERNLLAQAQQGASPRLEHNQHLQEGLAAAVQTHAHLKQTQWAEHNRFNAPPWPIDQHLEEAARQVGQYFQSRQPHSQETDQTALERAFWQKRHGYQQLADPYRADSLEIYTRASITLMQENAQRRGSASLAQRANDAQQHLTEYRRGVLEREPERLPPASIAITHEQPLRPNSITNLTPTMEQEKNSSEELQTTGRQAADALRGYGYTDFAQEYERALHRSALDPREMLAHSRIASITLKELNDLSEEKQGKHPALERNVEVQQKLDVALQKQKELSLEKPKSIQDLSFPAKMYLEENSKLLEHAAQEVTNYLDEKRAYSHSAEGKTLLQSHLDIQLQSYRSLPTSYNMERLETYTKEGITVMRNDFEQAKTSLQRENEDYVRERMYLSPEGKTSILREVEKGEFMMPNQQRGYIVESRTDYAQQQLDQYTKTKEQIFSIDQERSEGPGRQSASWKQALSSPAVEKDEAKLTGASVNQAEAWWTTLQKDYSHLSAEQQERYADLQSRIVPTAPSKDQEMEL